MDFITIFRAGLKKHKITLIVIAILCMIVSTSVNTAAAVLKSSRNYVNSEMERIGYGDITYWLSGCEDYALLVEQIDQLDTVKSAKLQNIIYSGYSMNGQHSDDEGQLIAYTPDEYDYKFLSADLKNYVDTQSIGENEIYISPSMKSSFNAEIGDMITFDLSRANDKAVFTVAGFYEDPFMGSSMIDMKGFLISEDGFVNLNNQIDDISDFNVLAETGAILHVTSADSDISSEQFGRTLRQSTDIGKYTKFMYSKETISGFMLILQEIFTGFLFGFAAILLIASLIIIGHTISFSIEQERTDIGILKAMGCTSGFLRRVFLCQYWLAIIAGLLVGIAAAFPLTSTVSSANTTSCGLLIPTAISPVFILIFTFLWLAIMTLFIFLFTGKITKITPVKAINGISEKAVRSAKNKISSKSLSVSVGLRQFLSEKKRYIGICLISAILVIFTGIVARMNTWLGPNGEGLMDAFSAADHDIGFQPVTSINMNEVEDIISRYDSIREIYGLAMLNASIDGADCTANVIDNTSKFHIISGRTPANPNEIVVTRYIAENIGKSVGDDVTVESGGSTAVYHISGIYQCANEMGANIGMSQQGYERLAELGSYIWCYHYILADGSHNEEILQELQERFRVEANIHTNSWSGLDGIVSSMHLLTVFMYAVTALFILAAVCLEGGKMLRSEEKNLAIYKSIGFTSNQLRAGFSIRITLASAFGAVIGIILCTFTADSIISMLMSHFGIGQFVSKYGTVSSALAGFVIIILFFAFSFWYSRRIRKVPVSVLAAEN